MEYLAVAAIGAGLGLAFTLFDFSWGTVRFLSGWIGYSPTALLVLNAVAGAVIVCAEFWLATTLWQALS